MILKTCMNHIIGLIPLSSIVLRHFQFVSGGLQLRAGKINEKSRKRQRHVGFVLLLIFNVIVSAEVMQSPTTIRLICKAKEILINRCLPQVGYRC